MIRIKIDDRMTSSYCVVEDVDLDDSIRTGLKQNQLNFFARNKRRKSDNL